MNDFKSQTISNVENILNILIEFLKFVSCSCFIGQLSNPEHASIPIGSANRKRELGIRPRSGLWHRKDGRFGRKIKPPPPVLVMKPEETPEFYNIRITLPQHDIEYPKGYV